MKRRSLNAVLSLIIALGTLQLLTPATARAATEEGCCKSATQECCGDFCRADGDSCISCNGFASIVCALIY